MLLLYQFFHIKERSVQIITIYYDLLRIFRFVLRTLKEFGFGNVTMEDIILNDAVCLTNMIESSAKSGPIANLYTITSIAVLNSLWTLVAGSRYAVNLL